MKEDYPNRKPLRMRGYDYSQNGAYFITVCTVKKEEILSQIMPAPVGVGAHDDPLIDVRNNKIGASITLTPIGEIVEKYILSSNRIEGVRIENYVIMPNHIHMIIVIDSPIRHDDVPAGFEHGTSKAPSPTNSSHTNHYSNMLIPHVISTFKRFVRHEVGYNIFQRSYHDRIIRNHNEYVKIAKYIAENPINWNTDCFYPAVDQ